jgi:hypothetical protein
VLNIDAANNITDSGLGIAVGANVGYLGVDLLATDGNHVFVSTASGLTSIGVASNKVSGTVAAGATPTAVAVTGTFPPHRLPPPHP